MKYPLHYKQTVLSEESSCLSYQLSSKFTSAGDCGKANQLQSKSIYGYFLINYFLTRKQMSEQKVVVLMS